MANTSKQDMAIKMANDLIALVQQAKYLFDQLTAYNEKNASNTPDSFWRQMATAAVGADGSIGAADGTPVLTHPITVGGLNRPQADLLPGLTFAGEFVQFVSGTLPTNRAAVDRRSVLDTLIG